MAARPDLVVALAQKIQDIPDGVTVGRRGGTWGAKAGASKPVEIKVDAMHPDDLMRPEHYEQTEESLGFKQEFCSVAGNPKPAPILLFTWMEDQLW
jgi:SYP7 family syntaxin